MSKSGPSYVSWKLIALAVHGWHFLRGEKERVPFSPCLGALGVGDCLSSPRYDASMSSEARANDAMGSLSSTDGFFDNIVTEEPNSATVTANNSRHQAASADNLQEYASTLVAEEDLQ
ncbi:hypothetical protein llap_10293 [Limosa lapponica baueri]|uniref:Uncharacterized protein n=1 Tax=Limosa lapponica baueri TaxID=1758121 RepID=A0A2I0U004_LIMLA|nr:hypothetical protein llap_10293 [Limosa lapponica baueri]